MTLTDSGLREHFNVTVVAIKRRGGEFTYTTPETIVSDSDQLIVSGSIACVESFADLV
ncbi:TrkA C-terminal domain-containing protein [Nocardia thraciensis]